MALKGQVGFKGISQTNFFVRNSMGMWSAKFQLALSYYSLNSLIDFPLIPV